MMLKPGGASGEGDEALECYAKHTAQIEVTTHNLLSHRRISQKQVNHLESSVFAKKMPPNKHHVEQQRWRYLLRGGDCVSPCSDCASGPHHGGDSVPGA